MADFTLTCYTPARKREWDTFVAASRNATFLHRRDYLEYHVDRFPDSSLMIYRDGKLHALLPATFNGTRFSSHAGLTYGGLLLNNKGTTAEVLQIMQLIRTYLRGLGATEFIYKPVPHIYHLIPTEEDLYALFRMDARIEARNVAAVIDTARPLKPRNIRKAGIRKAAEAGIAIEESNDFATFWYILSANLKERYGASPVHTLDEIIRLKSLFPSEIRLHTAHKDGEMLAGVVVYASPRVAHVQYISATPRGKELHALDLLFHHLLTSEYAGTPFFDFGTSNEDSGRLLNESLIYQKEGFGARAIVYDTYSIPL